MGRSKNKLSKFAEMMDFPNVVQNFDFLKPWADRCREEKK